MEMGQTVKIVLVENDLQYRAMLRDLLILEGHSVEEKDTILGKEADFRRDNTDLFILDEDLGDHSGFDELAYIRSNPKLKNAHVIFLSGNQEKQKILQAYTAGADDYILKTEDIAITLKKILAIGQRKRKINRTDLGLEFDDSNYSVSTENEKMSFTRTQYFLFYELASAYPNAVSREILLNRAFSGTNITQRTVDVHVCSLRKILKRIGIRIRTKRGIGYQLVGP